MTTPPWCRVKGMVYYYYYYLKTNYEGFEQTGFVHLFPLFEMVVYKETKINKGTCSCQCTRSKQSLPHECIVAVFVHHKYLHQSPNVLQE